jgi:hypothetical protein
VAALQAATRVLAGVALHSLDALGGSVTPAQFRMLAVLAEAGPARSARVARRSGWSPPPSPGSPTGWSPPGTWPGAATLATAAW